MWQRKWDEYKLLRVLSYRKFISVNREDPKDRQKRRCLIAACRKGLVELEFTPIDIVARLSPAKRYLYRKRSF